MKASTHFVAILLAVGLLGCKPKETTTTGQVFIVTRGGENVKLGAVEVLLIDKSQVTDFLRKKQPAIESVIQSRRRELAIASEAAQKAQSSFQWFLMHGRPATNADFLRISSQIDEALSQARTLMRQWYSLLAQEEQAERQGNSARANALNRQKEEVFENQKKKGAEAQLLGAKLTQFVQLKNLEETNKVELAASRLATAMKRLEDSPTAADYVESFWPVAVKKTLTDADGKFSLSFPRNHAFTIFAHAKRAVLGGAEEYYWLVDAPTNPDATQVFLSNNNLATVDPDGYFPLKPKRVR